jgi:hypothetical protein
MKTIPEAITKDGIKVVGRPPAFLIFQPDGFVYWSLNNAPSPDNKAIYKNLKKVLTEKDRPKREAIALAHLPTEPEQIFATRTRKAMDRLQKSLRSGDLEEAREAMRLVEVAIDYALEANNFLQLISRYLSVPAVERYYSFPDPADWPAAAAKIDNAGYQKACKMSEREAKEKLSEIGTLLQAARRFRFHESRAGTPFRNFDLAHGLFLTSVARLAGKLKRVPTRKEISETTGDSLQAVRKKLEAIGANWLLGERGPKSKLNLS